MPSNALPEASRIRRARTECRHCRELWKKGEKKNEWLSDTLLDASKLWSFLSWKDVQRLLCQLPFKADAHNGKRLICSKSHSWLETELWLQPQALITTQTLSPQSNFSSQRAFASPSGCFPIHLSLPFLWNILQTHSLFHTHNPCTEMWYELGWFFFCILP